MYTGTGNMRSFDRLGSWNEAIDLELGALLVLARGQRRMKNWALWKGMVDHHRKPALLTCFPKA